MSKYWSKYINYKFKTGFMLVLNFVNACNNEIFLSILIYFIDFICFNLI